MLTLNKEQEQAIAFGEGRVICRATAGSGKTTVLVERVKRLLYSNQPLNEILALTFTTEAAENMQDRLGITMAKNERGGFRTFHSFGLKIVNAEKHQIPWLSHNPYESNFGTKILYDVIRELYGRRLQKREIEELKQYISKAKRASVQFPRLLPEVLSEEQTLQWGPIFRAYDSRMKSEGQLDYDDMLVEAVRLLENPAVRARWQFQWVLCDEGQDTDNLQFRILQLVSQKHGNVFLVGDENQSIYGFRGAHPENMARFDWWFADAKTIILPENFRSTKEIVEFTKNIAPIKNELTAGMRTANEQGETVRVVNFLGTDDEVEQIANVLESLTGKTAILARTNQQIGLFETVLTAREIKFHLLGKSGFWRTPEIKTVMTYVQYVLGSDSDLHPYVKSMLENVKNSQWRMTARESVDGIIKDTNMRAMYANANYEEADNFALGNLAGVLQIASRFPNLEEFSTFAYKALHAGRKSKKAVTLGTIHSAKGLEWDNVFVVGVSDGRLPHDAALSDGPRALLEERCIFYVACSRAAKKLQLSYSGQRSRFLDELDEILEEGLNEQAI